MIKNKFENIKRITSVFLIIIMAASISSCNKNNDETEKADTFAEGITCLLYTSYFSIWKGI